MMGMDPQTKESRQKDRRAGRFVRALLVVLAAATGLGLMTDSLLRSSATYDEVLYLSVASRWWRTGDQTRITRAGSPLPWGCAARWQPTCH